MTAVMLASLGAFAACGATKPVALPDDASFRACLSKHGVSPDNLDSFATRRKAFAQPAPWDCVGALPTAGDRHAVLKDVFPPDDAALLTVLTAWINAQDADGADIAKNVGTLVAAADDPMPSDPGKNSARHNEDEAFQARLAMAIYRHKDGDLAGYADFVTTHHLEGDASAPFRYYNHVMNEGGPVADRLSGYASAIDAVRDHLRAT